MSQDPQTSLAPAPKRALIVGVANERSLAWAIAQKLHADGYQLAFTYLGESLERRVRPLAQSLGAHIIEPLDARDEAQVAALFAKLAQHWGGLECLVHSIAYAERTDLEGRFIDTSREGFLTALEVSAYTLVSLSRAALPLMTSGPVASQETGQVRDLSILTLSYLGAHRVVPNYNVMGVAKSALEACVKYLAYDLGEQKIRVNAISAGPVKTLAAAGIRDIRTMLASSAQKNPLRENIEAEDVGHLGAFLAGPGGRHITGTTMYVDSGAHIMGS